MAHNNIRNSRYKINTYKLSKKKKKKKKPDKNKQKFQFCLKMFSIMVSQNKHDLFSNISEFLFPFVIVLDIVCNFFNF